MTFALDDPVVVPTLTATQAGRRNGHGGGEGRDVKGERWEGERREGSHSDGTFSAGSYMLPTRTRTTHPTAASRAKGSRCAVLTDMENRYTRTRP